MSSNDQKAMDAIQILLEAADAVIADGVSHSRSDDPHRFATLHKEFDDGRARRRLVIDYAGSGTVRVSFHLSGTQQGEPIVCEVFGLNLQGPVPKAQEH